MKQFTNMADINVLFIDDDATIRTLATAMLKNRGMRILAALRSRQADQILKTEKVDIIVCDVMMPDEDGFQYRQRLRREGNSLPFLFLTAVSDPASHHRAADLGAVDYLVKPFDIYALEKRIRTLVRPSASPADTSPSHPTSPSRPWLNSLIGH
jgi:two-component system OmpR family response regulator